MKCSERNISVYPRLKGIVNIIDIKVEIKLELQFEPENLDVCFAK